jgi:hypothetical protein
MIKETVIMTRKIVTVAALASAGLLATACGTASQQGNAGMSGTTPAPAAAAQPAVNPVPILKQTGAKVPASEVLGDHDVFGNRMAEGSFGQEQVTVYTTTNLRQAKAEAPGDFTVDDGDAVITGHNFWITVTGVADITANGTPHAVFTVKPSVIAQRVHGQLAGA